MKSNATPLDPHPGSAGPRNPNQITGEPERGDRGSLPPAPGSCDVYRPVQPERKRSMLITSGGTAYRAHADSSLAGPAVDPDLMLSGDAGERGLLNGGLDVRSSCTGPVGSPLADTRGPRSRINLGLALAAAPKDGAGPKRTSDDPIDNYKFFIGDHACTAISSGLAAKGENDGLDNQGRRASGMYVSPGDPVTYPSRYLADETTTDGPDGGSAVDCQKGGNDSTELLVEVTKDPMTPVPQFYPCVSQYDLSNDSEGLVAFTKTIQSSAFYQNALFAFRSTAVASIPTYVLLMYPYTSHFFAIGMLVPVFSIVFAKPTLGRQGQAIASCIQASVVFCLWSVIMNAIGIIHYEISWWLALFFIILAVSLLGGLPAKRLMMAQILLNMQMEHLPGGDELIFSIKFLRDFWIACGMSFIAALLPYPILSRTECTEAMTRLHKLYSAAVGNAMKSYWASVRIDGSSALTQIPFTKIDDLTAQIRELIIEIQYEISEFGLDNTFREERLSALKRIKMHLYTMAAAASHRLDGGERSYISRDVQEFEKRVRLPAMDLASEVMSILVAMGDHLRPADLATKLDFTNLSNKACILADIIEREQAQMLFLKRSADAAVAREATNSYLHTLSFLSSLVNISSELQKMETEGRNFDVSKYPTVWRRAFNFFLADLWNDFWSELPKRFTLATPRDVRLWKDAIRYAIAFTLVNLFAIYNDSEVIYYFSVIIMMRIVQQTASETLSSSVYHIFGLSIGIAVSFFLNHTIHGIPAKALMTAVFVFILVFFSQNKIFGASIQYAAMAIYSGQGSLGSPALVTVRLIDITFAFMLYLLICGLVFPVDPIHCLWNARVKAFISLNSVLQSIVALGCAPVTVSGLEAKFLADIAREGAKEQQLVLKEYASWMPKAEVEPTLRGGEYPIFPCRKLLLYLKEISALEESVLDAMVKLHRPRERPPSVLVLDIMELIKPFMIDASKIVHRFFQSVIDATESPLQWSMEDALRTTWKAQLACRSLKRVTGNIQRNFFAAYQELSAEEKHELNPYSSSSRMVSPRQEYEFSSVKSFDDDTFQRLCTLSFYLSARPLLSHEDVAAFNVIVTVFDLILRIMGRILPHVIAIHEFEKSRVA